MQASADTPGRGWEVLVGEGEVGAGRGGVRDSEKEQKTRKSQSWNRVIGLARVWRDAGIFH